MEADFSGYATKAGLKCSDGRTIMPDAFKHQDTMTVPLVWQHGHTDPENVLGHAVLENRDDGVYCYGFFNESAKAQHTRGLLEHKDITMMSIWANDLIERAGRVLHGAIREVSLVLSGANPGAVIENVTIRHSDMEDTLLDDEAIIYTGLPIEPGNLQHDSGSSSGSNNSSGASDSSTSDSDGPTIQGVYDSMTPDQQNVVNYLVGEAISQTEEAAAEAQAAAVAKATAQATADSNNNSSTTNAQHDNLDGAAGDNQKGTQMGNEVKHNIFEEQETKNSNVLSHDAMIGIIEDAKRNGSLKDAFESYALAHGIDDINTLFPEPVATDTTPQFLSRRVEWVATLLGAVQKSPFSRIKTLNADITVEEARAKGYVTGALKKEEFFNVAKRVTTPTTIYKKQQLDRDDVVDITDFDVISWLQQEMRLMLDEEIARAILMGDGRDISDADKIQEGNIRPIAKEHELFATTITVDLNTVGTNADNIIDAVINSRWQFKGTGMPTLFTSETVIASFLMVKDTLGRRLYQNLDEVATVLRVSAIVPVEAMEGYEDLVGIIVNPVDYTLGATAGGAVNMFDFFDIDYNKQKYLIETRCSGALTRLKSAIVIRQSDVGAVSVTPNAPTFDSSTGIVTIVATTGVTYQDANTGATLSTGAQAALAIDTAQTVVAIPADGYYLPSDAAAVWTFAYDGGS